MKVCRVLTGEGRGSGGYGEYGEVEERCEDEIRRGGVCFFHAAGVPASEQVACRVH